MLFRSVNCSSKKPQKVLLKIRQVQNKQATIGKIAIPTAAYYSVTANAQSYINAVSRFDFKADIIYDPAKGFVLGPEFERTLLFENIYYSKAGDTTGLHYSSGNVYGPIGFHHFKKGRFEEIDDRKYTTLEDYNKALKDVLETDPVQWVIRKNGKELGVIQTSKSEVDATNSIDEEFHLRIEDIKIVGDIIDPTKLKSFLWDNYTDVTSDEGRLDYGSVKSYFNVIDSGKEFSITDTFTDAGRGDKDFSLVINQIDDNLDAKLDVYHFGEEEGNNSRPVVIGIHAGVWKTDQNKNEFAGSKPNFFRKRDCIFVNVEYRVSPQPPPNASGVYLGYDKERVKFPAQIEDIAASVKWVRDNISKYGGNPNNIILYGHGSGAHLATLLISNKKWLNAAGVDPSIIKGCISSSNIAWNIKNEIDKYSDSLVPDTKVSIYNAFGIDPSVGGPEAKIDFETSDDAKATYDLYSPDVNVSKDISPLLILSRGPEATLQRADNFVKKLDSVGVASTSVFHYKYPDNKTYDQVTIQGVVGVSPDPPLGFVLPKSVVNVSTAIGDFLKKISPFVFPTDAIIEYPKIDGETFSAVSGISTIPLSLLPSSPAASGTSPASDAKSSSDSSKSITLPSGGIFGKPGVEAISIGYIDPVLGYVTGLSICEANEKAEESPGTTFVAIDGDNSVNYLSINDVNKLTADFTESKTNCEGLKATVNCGEPILNIFGGGGVGAKANVIIGTDGSVIGVDLVHKGYGYQYPPLVQAIDKCYFGNGATFEAFLGEVADKEETFDKETDFEDYYVCPPGTSFGTLYDTSGKEVGKWDPSLYTNPSANPIAKQVEDYEKLINQIKKPWWTTRLKKPSKLSGVKDKSLTVYPVSHPCQVVEVEDLPESSSTSVSDSEEITFTLNPDGKSNNIGTIIKFTSTDKGGDSFTLQPSSNSKDTTKKIKIKKNVKYDISVTKVAEEYGGVNVFKNISDKKILIDYQKSAGDDNDLFISSNIGKFTIDSKKKTGSFILETSTSTAKSVEPKKEKVSPEKTWSDFMNTYAVSPVSPSNLPGTDFSATPFTMEWDQIFPYDGDYIFRGLCDNIGILYLDNEKITDLQGFNQDPKEITKNVKGGLHTIRIDLENKPIMESKVLPTFVDFTIKGGASKSGDLLDNIFFTFTSDDGKDSFTFRAREKDQLVSTSSKESTASSELKAEFDKVGDKIFINVIGKGSGKIKFTAKVKDSLTTAGVAAKEIKIPAEGSTVSLKRTPGKSVEVISDSAVFKAGKTYGPIQIIGATKNAGKPSVNKNKIGLLDGDGKDKNIEITFDIGSGPTLSNSLLWERKETVKIRPNVLYKVVAHENTKKYDGVEQGIFVTKKGDSQEVGEGTGNKIFADFLESANDNDDIQIIADEGQFKSFNKRKVNDGKGRTTYDLTYFYEKKEIDLGKVTKENIFDTSSFIDKADRKLWKINPKVGTDADFISRYGVSPFDTTTKEAETESYAGTHPIRWEKINFPVDGTYSIDVAVDDNVKIYIGNKASGGKVEDGSGLKSASDGGDEEIIEVKGFNSFGASFGKQTFTRKFKAGDYRIRAELEQIPGKSLAKGNPMILAMQITRSEGGVKDIISKKSWCENPLGAAVTIEVPPVPVPQEPSIVFDHCPPTPLWSTRQPKSEKIWYPVKYNGYKTFTEQIKKVEPVSTYQDVEFTVTGEGGVGGKSIGYLEFFFESTDKKESFVLKGVELAKDKKTGRYRVNQKIKKNLKYIVTARISDTKKAGFTQVEQGLSVIKGKSVDEAKKTKEKGTSIFADFIGSSNDNDDIGVSIIKGDGEFSIGKRSTVGGRSTYELFYELQSKEKAPEKTIEVKSIGGWSKFLNRYAISPVQPLYTPGTDGGGKTYENSWDVEFPYDGFYKFEAEADDSAKVYVDGKELINIEKIGNFTSTKEFISKGKHKIKVEVANVKTEIYEDIDEKIFSTKDKVSGNNTREVVFTVKGEAGKYGNTLDNIFFTFTSDDGKDSFTFKARETDQSKSKESTASSGLKAKFNKVGNNIFLVVDGSGTGKINFFAEVDDSLTTAGVAAKEILIPAEGSTVSLKRTPGKSTETLKDSATFMGGKTYGPIQIVGAIKNAGKSIVSDNKIGLLDGDGKDQNIRITFDVQGLSSGGLVWERTEKVTIRTNVSYNVVAHENAKKYTGVEQGKIGRAHV